MPRPEHGRAPRLIVVPWWESYRRNTHVTPGFKRVPWTVTDPHTWLIMRAWLRQNHTLFEER